MHIEILNIAYKYLLSLKDYNVLCAFISPSADCYVKYKRPPNFPFELRCKMVEASIEEFKRENKEKDKVNIYLNKWEGSHNFFIDFPDVITEIQYELSKFGEIKLLYVCGIDHYIKCIYCFDKNVIAIDREPYKINENDYRFKSNEAKLKFIIKDKNAAPFSSTSIKDSYEKNDLETIKQCTYSEVYSMIIEYLDSLNPEKHQEKNYEEINKEQQQHKDF